VAAAQAAATAAGTVSVTDDAQAAIQQAAADLDLAYKNRVDDPVGYFNALAGYNRAKLSAAQAAKQEAEAIHDTLGATVGGPLAQAISAMRDAQRAVQLAVTAAEQNAAQIQLLQAKSQKRDALRNFASNVRKLGLDLTNPLQVAQEEVTAAVDKLNQDRARFKSGGISKAERDVLNQDKLDVRSARNNARDTAFNQGLQDQKTALDLGRISQSEYMNFLHTQETQLRTRIAGLKKTSNGYKQATDELNQILELEKEIADSFNAQFNLGDITLPTPFQARSYLQSGFGGPGGGSSTVIQINGADTGQIIQILSQYMGSGNTYTVGGY
jgi:hypothetical protein